MISKAAISEKTRKVLVDQAVVRHKVRLVFYPVQLNQQAGHMTFRAGEQNQFNGELLPGWG